MCSAWFLDSECMAENMKHTQFQWMFEEFLPYMDYWEESVAKQEGIASSAKNMMLLRREIWCIHLH